MSANDTDRNATSAPGTRDRQLSKDASLIVAAGILPGFIILGCLFVNVPRILAAKRKRKLQKAAQRKLSRAPKVHTFQHPIAPPYRPLPTETLQPVAVAEPPTRPPPPFIRHPPGSLPRHAPLSNGLPRETSRTPLQALSEDYPMPVTAPVDKVRSSPLVEKFPEENPALEGVVNKSYSSDSLPKRSYEFESPELSWPDDLGSFYSINFKTYSRQSSGVGKPSRDTSKRTRKTSVDQAVLAFRKFSG